VPPLQTVCAGTVVYQVSFSQPSWAVLWYLQ